MLTKKQIESLPKGEYPNSVLNKKFGGHGTKVKFLTDPKVGLPQIVSFTSNRWWSRHRKRNPIVPSKAKKHNITTETRSIEKKKSLFGKAKDAFKSFFK